ncbi:MAG: hypothetical protein MI741_00270, partial [Rhodospirillales bacterium]|nr:hypothetical protein [Rhodospirillales bacterium]
MATAICLTGNVLAAGSAEMATVREERGLRVAGAPTRQPLVTAQKDDRRGRKPRRGDKPPRGDRPGGGQKYSIEQAVSDRAQL